MLAKETAARWPFRTGFCHHLNKGKHLLVEFCCLERKTLTIFQADLSCVPYPMLEISWLKQPISILQPDLNIPLAMMRGLQQEAEIKLSPPNTNQPHIKQQPRCVSVSGVLCWFEAGCRWAMTGPRATVRQSSVHQQSRHVSTAIL